MPVADVKSYPEGKGPSTPWGRAQYAQNLERGVTFYGTAGHGGMSITMAWAKANLTPHAAMLGQVYASKLWYEEDAAVTVVMHERPELCARMMGNALNAERNQRLVREYYPEYFDPDFRAACFLAFPMPEPKDLVEGHEIDLESFGSPGNVRTFTYIQPYGSKGKDLLVRGDEGGIYKISQAQYMNETCQIRLGSEVLWDRPQAPKKYLTTKHSDLH